MNETRDGALKRLQKIIFEERQDAYARGVTEGRELAGIGVLEGLAGFGQALEHLKAGARVARAGWNGKGMWLVLVKSEMAAVDPQESRRPRQLQRGMGGPLRECYPLLPWIGMKTADDKFVSWLASQTDMLAEDWVILDHTELTTDR